MPVFGKDHAQKDPRERVRPIVVNDPLRAWPDTMELTLATGTIMEIALKSAPSISPDPIGDMTLAPIMMTGRTEAELARAMAEHLQAARPGSGSEAQRLPELAAHPAGDRARRADAAIVGLALTSLPRHGRA